MKILLGISIVLWIIWCTLWGMESYTEAGSALPIATAIFWFSLAFGGLLNGLLAVVTYWMGKL